ncbi:carbamoyl phosphate synthase large subunit [Candidatus Gottesmanbacteria bacterium RIFCSPHIGHO2_01_FULL_39_10]|uniref:Carbamoyl phosphate synthase arginine-specific large chain n=1 Tax=Candidatus Gottesmanbacteria bacterium RIFCSPHIGHO2_01_FULL_39_10 TaxID=1798375 RepID=A0A1F5ZKX2_9BACT|nr:MAG: carbamoyl phosphate synthase large subunit [Candidatus Gottesmanbacteria bacterium RIFCSPHIGHO2_01_FULL_39_10]
MEKKKLNLKKVLLLGSGALKIGEAGEFDYSGSQAAKALKEEGIDVILVNPNIATIQTSTQFVTDVYFLPVTPYFVEKIIAKEKPDGILLGFGGQTALNCGLELYKKGVFKKYNLKVLGTPVSAIEKTEDRLLFRKAIEDLGFKVPKSFVAKSTKDVDVIKKTLNYPVIVRAGFSLGGLGSGIARNEDELQSTSEKALTLTPQILIEEYLEHWKEIEYEVVRDKNDNTIVVCNMENFDPMGIHTGESIVVAPSQTLTNQEYHSLREISIKVIKSLPIIGECNIQYALNPKNGDYRIIEVNARLSRSSALASKATGYPLAYVAAKLALGYDLSEIPNQVTKKTSAFFEPALDYIVVKIPRWDFLKFKNIESKLGSEMQSVGEVMAIGRTFEEALQKGIRSLSLDYEGIISDDLKEEKLSQNISLFSSLDPTPDRPYNIAANLFYGQSVKEIYEETGIDPWFIGGIKNIVDLYKKMLIESKTGRPSKEILLQAKKLGFSDNQIAYIYGLTWKDVRNLRIKMGITPKISQIDTLGGEFPAETNYLYFSYHRETHDIKKEIAKKVAVIGGGPYQIGSSVEFDWCAVNSILSAKKLGYHGIMINCNPETVSTDYDISDRLYFEELSLERILDIADFENCPFIVSVGGQIPNTLAHKLAKENIPLLGTDWASIDRVEDREKFSALLDKLAIKQPAWKRLKDSGEALKFAQAIGFPVLIRPSYVLSGRAMFVAYSQEQLTAYFSQSTTLINPEYPVVISKFIKGAKEVDFDAVAQKGKLVVWAISEHVENAGVHSGDATLVLPTFSLNTKAKELILENSEKIIKSLDVTGPINIQYIVKDNQSPHPQALVIEANLRASRSFPFVSKVLNTNFVDLATQIILGKKMENKDLKKPAFFGVKIPHFSFTRLRKADPVLRVEMASTGEVACFGDDLDSAYLMGILSTGFEYPKKSALLSLGGKEGKERVLPSAKTLIAHGFKIYATDKTSKFLKNNGIAANLVYKVHEGKHPHVVDLIKEKKIGFVIDISDKSDLAVSEFTKAETDGYLIRRAAVDSNIPLFTRASIANLFVESISRYKPDMLEIKSWREYVKKI